MHVPRRAIYRERSLLIDRLGTTLIVKINCRNINDDWLSVWIIVGKATGVYSFRGQTMATKFSAISTSPAPIVDISSEQTTLWIGSDIHVSFGKGQLDISRQTQPYQQSYGEMSEGRIIMLCKVMFTIKVRFNRCCPSIAVPVEEVAKCHISNKMAGYRCGL